MNGSKRLVKNSVANLARGASAGLVAVILPAVLVRALPTAAYSAWAIVLQIAAYVAMLDLGLQVGIGRFIARETAREDDAKRAQFFWSGALLLTGCALVALLLTFLLAGFLPGLFPRIPASLIPQCRLAVLLVGGSSALSLPGAAMAAVFVGLERFDIPALVLGVGRVVQIACCSAVALHSHDIVRIALAYGACNLLIQLAYLVLLLKLGPSLDRKGAAGGSGVVLKELFHYCASLSVWSFSMLLVYGLDTAIVAELDFKAVAAYSICTNLVGVLVGAIGSMFNVLISRASALDGRGEHKEVGRLLIAASKVCTTLLLGIGIGGALFATPLFMAWVGPKLGVQALPFFWVLFAANGIRLCLVPYATVLMGTGEHKWATITTLAEGSTNLIASIALGRAYGAIGVAYGTLVGTVVGTTLALVFTFPRAKRIDCPRGEYLISGFVRPAACYLPLAASAFWYLNSPSLGTSTAPSLGLFVTGYLLLKFRLFSIPSEPNRMAVQ